MQKRFQHISKFLLIITLVFVVSNSVFIETTQAQFQFRGPVTFEDIKNAVPEALGKLLSVGANILLAPFAYMSIIFLQISKLLLILSGILLNHVVLYTVVQMGTNMNSDTIAETWTTIRDVANMFFIFILLYAAIKTILGMGSDTKKLIIRVIIVAILINFSLFFTRVVIDASNVLAINFYDAIAPNSLNSEEMLEGGLSKRLSEPLKLGTLIDVEPDGINTGPTLFQPRQLLIVGILGSAFVLIASFVFFAMSLMLIIRFVVLMFVLILSPIAFMSFVLPALEGAGKQWKEALLGQAFFAPIFFLILWIDVSIIDNVLTLDGGSFTKALTGVGKAEGGTTIDPGSVKVIMNFIIIIVLLNASLVISKSWADKAGSTVAGMNKWAGKVAGGASFGLAGFAGRQTVGRVGNLVGESETLKRWARSYNAAGRMAGRLGLAAGRKTATASFDGRGTAIGVPLDAGKAQKGGYTQYRKTKDEREDKFAASLEASAKAKAKTKKELSDAEKEHENAVKDYGENSLKALEARERVTKARETHSEIHGNKQEIADKTEAAEKDKNNKIKDIDDANANNLKEAEEKEKEARNAVTKLESEVSTIASAENDAKLRELGEKKKALEATRLASETLNTKIRIQKDQVLNAYRKQVADINAIEKVEEGKITRRRTFANTVENSTWAKFSGYNYSGAAKIRVGVKTNKDKVVEAIQALEKEGGAESPSAEKAETTEEKTEKDSSNPKT